MSILHPLQRMLTRLSALLASLAAIAGCTATARTDSAERPPAGVPGVERGIHPEWSKNAVIYEVNIRQYTPAGTFAAFTKELPRIRALGVDILWIMPVQPIGTLNRKGTLGSYYSIADYTSINPEFGTEADFKAMVYAAHAQGFKVILDWVANHTAHDHHWTREHRDWYTRHADGTLSRPIDPDGKETDWTDVVDLDYGSKPMRAAMIKEMRWWVDSTGIDGFRCDVAGFVPHDFWAEARAVLLKAKPDLFFLAEWEDPKLHTSFDMTYGWELFHLLNDVASGKKKASELAGYFSGFETKFPADAFRMNFTSNHDENSWNGTEFERMGANHKAAFVLDATTAKSMPLLYSGQEASFNRRLPFFEKDSIDWNGASLAAFYRSIFDLRHTQDVLWNGQWGAPQVVLTTNAPDQVFAFVRSRGDKAVLVATNFGKASTTVTLTDFQTTGGYTDWFTKAAVSLTAGATLDIPANGYRILVK